ncbi:hypothetical protein F0521_26450 [Ferrimonas sp. YFM]|nr:hypothetical protein F0521_26450 [Ferrimonas sp. YFM]
MSSFTEGGVPITAARDNLLEKWVYFANVCNFTFQFQSIEQVKDCKAYFEKKIHPSTRGNHPLFEHYWHPWYCKLPKGINKDARRVKVLKALQEILDKWG